MRTNATTDYYEITQKESQVEILPGLRTTVWGYDGIFPGPTIEARSGRQVVVRQRNELPVPVVVHLHGGRTPPESDGYPTDLIWPATAESDRATMAAKHASLGGVFGYKDYIYPNEQRGATLWYHDHRMDFTGPQVYRGLAGFYIIRDEIEDKLTLPRGAKDIPLMIADRTFNEDGSFFYPSLDPTLKKHGVQSGYHSGVQGDTILVNGAPWPVLEVSNTRYRFRLLNASNRRVYQLALDPPPSEGPSFIQVGSDGGLLSAPFNHDNILMAPAERFDVIVDFSRYQVGTQVRLKNLEENDNTSQVMRFDVVREERDESAVPDRLAPDEEPLDPAQAEAMRRVEFRRSGNMFLVNGQLFDPQRIDFRPRLGSTEIWDLYSDTRHPAHLHLVHFRVLSRNGQAPAPYDGGWKDTVHIRAGHTVRVIARFSGYRGKYVYHCHVLEHEDMAMMANFEVV